MRADEAREIDAMARANNRRESDKPLGCLPAVLITVASWAVIIAIVLRLQHWGKS